MTTTKQINWEAQPGEYAIIKAIAKRAVIKASEDGIDYCVIGDVIMDIAATHLNGCPLDLQKLLDAPEPHFGHDIYGIRRFLDRSTGELTDCFLPRCALLVNAKNKTANDGIKALVDRGLKLPGITTPATPDRS